MPKLLCPHCLQPLDDGYRGDCPHCGRTLENRNPEGALPFGHPVGRQVHRGRVPERRR